MDLKVYRWVRTAFFAIAATATLVFFPVHFIFDSLFPIKLLIVTVLTFFSDNLPIYWKKDRKVVSNAIGFLAAYLFGKEYILAAAVTTTFRINFKQDASVIIYRFLAYFMMYYPAAIISGFFSNKIFSAIIYLHLVIIFNIIIVNIIGRRRIDKSSTLIEYLLFMSLLPAIVVFYNTTSILINVMIFIMEIIVLFFFFFSSKYFYERREEKMKNDRLKKYNTVVFDFSQILKALALKIEVEEILDKVADICKNQLGFQKVLISLFNLQDGKVRRITHKGLTDEQYEQVKNREVAIEEIRAFMDEKNRYLETYFIPSEQIDPANQVTFKFDETKKVYEDDGLSHESWTADDMLLLSFRNSNDRIIGYASLDSPVNGLRPTQEDLTILSVFAQTISLTLVNSQVYNQALDVAFKDGLTGLYNHSKLFEDLSVNWGKGVLASIAFMDLDNFKTVNDTKGHVYGDKILKSIADLFMIHVRIQDKVYRYGGDEFVIIFSGVDKSSCRVVLERLLVKMKESINENISFSVGITDSNERPDYREALNLADRRSYISKFTGKGKIISEEK